MRLRFFTYQLSGHVSNPKMRLYPIVFSGLTGSHFWNRTTPNVFSLIPSHYPHHILRNIVIKVSTDHGNPMKVKGTSTLLTVRGVPIFMVYLYLFIYIYIKEVLLSTTNPDSLMKENFYVTNEVILVKLSKLIK